LEAPQLVPQLAAVLSVLRLEARFLTSLSVAMLSARRLVLHLAVVVIL
jgi:hypothetical protein